MDEAIRTAAISPRRQRLIDDMTMTSAALLVSSWLDVTPSGDTEASLHVADPNQLYEKHGKYATAAFADP